MTKSVQDLKYVKLGLVESIMYGYAEFRNVRPSPPGYSNKLRPHRITMCRRPGFSVLDARWYSFVPCTIGNKVVSFLDGGTITDSIVIDDVEYVMWIADDDSTIRIYRTQDGCQFVLVAEDCFCKGGSRKFQLINFPKGRPKSLFTYTTTTGVLKYTNNGVQRNYTYEDIDKGLADLYDPFADEDHIEWNFNQGQFSIQPGDYVYAYDIEEGLSALDNGICGQWNIVAGLNRTTNALEMQNFWVGLNPGVINQRKAREKYGDNIPPTDQLDYGDYIQPPQLEGHNIKYMVFGDFGETIARQTCNGINVLHNDRGFFEEASSNQEIDVVMCDPIITTMCNFNRCYLDNVTYTGANGAEYGVHLEANKSYIAYSSLGQQAFLGAGNIVNIKDGSTGMTTFQNFIVYFGKSFIGAMYLTEQVNNLTTVQETVSNGNIIRKNLGIWTNSNGRGEAYDEYDNVFMFLGSNKRLYALSILASDTGLLTSKLQDMTEDDWGKRIIGDLENIQEGDDVHIQGDEDKFRIIINSSERGTGRNTNTKVLTRWRRWKIWTTDTSCCAVFSKYVKNVRGKERMLGPTLFHECGDKDCLGQPFEWMIKSYLFEDEVTLTDDGTFNMKEIAYIQTQIHTPFDRVESATELVLRAYRSGIRTETVADAMHTLPYLDTIHDITRGKKPTLSQCLIDKMSSCEKPMGEKCETSRYNYRVDGYDYYQKPEGDDWGCDCPPQRILSDYCFCTNEQLYHMSPFVNLRTETDNVKGEMFELILRGYDDVCFGGWQVAYRGYMPHEQTNECNDWDCNCKPEEERQCCIIRDQYNCF